MSDPPSSETLVESILELAPHIAVAHHVPGRVRLKVLPAGVQLLKQKKRQAGDVGFPVESLPGIRKLRTNYLAKSVAIDYDASVLTVELWTTLDLVRTQPELLERLRRLLETALNGGGNA